MLTTTPPTLTARSGHTAQRERLGDLEALTLRDAGGRLLLSVDEATGRIVLESTGDLALRATGGSVTVQAERFCVDATTIDLRARRMRQRVGILETRAKRILERATDVYREAEELAQLRAKDIRFVATDTLRSLAARVRVKAREDVKLKGEQIHLG